MWIKICDHCQKPFIDGGWFLNLNNDKKNPLKYDMHFHNDCFLLSDKVPNDQKIAAVKEHPERYTNLNKLTAPYELMDL